MYLSHQNKCVAIADKHTAQSNDIVISNDDCDLITEDIFCRSVEHTSATDCKHRISQNMNKENLSL